MSKNIKNWYKVEFRTVDSPSWAVEIEELYCTHESLMAFVNQLKADPSLEIIDYYEEEIPEEEEGVI